MAIDFSGLGTIGAGIGDLFDAAMSKDAAKSLDVAGTMEETNAKIAKASIGIQHAAIARDIYKVTGGQRADIAGGGFTLSGSALDVMQDSARQGSLAQSLVQNQGMIEVQAHEIQAYTLHAQAAQARAQAAASTFGGIVNIGLGILGLFSDARLKEDLVSVGADENGVPMYTWRYLGGKETWKGYLAQDVFKVDPEAVTSAVGFMSVGEKYAPVRV